jgi:hypothetical protein
MPLSPAVPRNSIHTRRIECHGYLREDGLWDIEGRITDVKSYPFHNEWRGQMEPGTPIHDMTIRLTVDNEFVVRAVETVMDGTPYPICPEVNPNFQRLVGLQIQSGWRRRVRDLLGGTQGCTHMVELLSPLATVVLQTIRPYKRYLVKQNLATGESDPTVRRPQQIDTCYSWSREREVVRRFLPDHHAGTPEDPSVSPDSPLPTGS